MNDLKVRRIYLSELIRNQIINIQRDVFPKDSQNYAQSSATEEEIGYYFGVFPVHEGKESIKLLGYIYWVHIEGVRPAIELEQIGIDKEHQGKGIDTLLIDESIGCMEEEVKKKGFNGIERIKVTIGSENNAQKLYVNTLGAKVDATLPEGAMFAKREEINEARKNRGLKTLDEIF